MSLDPERASADVAASCSRARSRQARAMLEEFFYPVAEGAKTEIAATCPFSRIRDVFYEHERHKERVRHSKQYWRSLYSGKVFKSEYYVDKHMERRHGDKIPPGANVCLADHCEVLQCDRHASYMNGERGKLVRCDAAHMADVQAECRKMLKSCFPHESGRAAERSRKVHDYLNKYYCDQLTCVGVGGVFELMSTHHETAGASYYVSLGFVMLLVALYYFLVYSWVNGRGVSLDVKRAHRRARASWIDYFPRALITFLKIEKRKRKAY